ncbi:MAG: glycerol acyltransferase, partial [Taibaiella sp.]|nr:glycerol acyltransferase [Taibaiella sp.]
PIGQGSGKGGLKHGHPSGPGQVGRRRTTFFDKIARWQPERNKWLVLFIFLLTPVMLYFSTGVQFDSNLMNLNYLSPELQRAQEEVSEVNTVALSSVFVVAQEKSEDKALQQLETVKQQVAELESKGWVKGTSDPTMLLPSVQEQQERLTRWRNYWGEERTSRVVAHVNEAAAKTGYAQNAFARFGETLQGEYSTFDEETIRTLKTFFPGGFSADGNQHYAIIALKVPAEHRDEVFETLSKQESVTITDRQQGATQLVAILNNDFTDIAVYSSLIVFFALLIGYGRIELAIIAFLPMAISWIWILGLMSLLGLKFNIVNIIISSLIFGLGDDYTIFTMDGLVERLK